MRQERTCIGCRDKGGKAGLYRIVKAPTGDVSFDETGRKPGRGAYVCSIDCFDKVGSNGRLASALRVKLTEDSLGSIRGSLEEAVEAKGRSEV